MNNRLIGDAGEYLVAYHLSRRGIAVALMNNGTKGVDLLVTDDSQHVASIQVKASQGKTQPRQWIVGKNQPRASENFFYIFCNIWIELDKTPEIFIVPSDDVKTAVKWESKVPLFKITPDNEGKYLNNWKAITDIFITS
ncbi:hypothetical protein [Shewanella sp. SM29]|uniref:hypothetical protein n=1 Tax=Shewanella sp. SM29 TaxID=2912795 RepID=UPI0021D9BA8E|nr:hypothetical protein [Shewanella sp. SM29]MCU8073874.1 hypothetical protein [Shewanella sp. SM29]